MDTVTAMHCMEGRKTGNNSQQYGGVTHGRRNEKGTDTGRNQRGSSQNGSRENVSELLQRYLSKKRNHYPETAQRDEELDHNPKILILREVK